ncbi:MAG TPA: glycosyltransferase [Opitutaceae bacterium]|nr:glycosyltransferase [Opitutaceae bacterium]
MNRILIVTPTLGESQFLERTIASVAKLPLPVIHVFSVPAHKQHALSAQYPGVRIVPDAGKAGGIYGALNAALTQVPDGWEWFTYINDDDTLLDGFNAMVRRHLSSPQPEPVVYGDVDLIDEDDRAISRITIERNPKWIPSLLHQGISPLMQQGTIFRRDTVKKLGGFDLRYKLCADLDFWLRAYASGHKFKSYPIRVAQFRVRNGQLSGNTKMTIAEQDEIVARHLPVPVSSMKKTLGRLRYRACNLPRYIARFRRRGLQTSYQLLQNESAK